MHRSLWVLLLQLAVCFHPHSPVQAGFFEQFSTILVGTYRGLDEATIADPLGELTGEALRLDFDRRLKLPRFRGHRTIWV